jgi:hypothetical protein
MLTGGQKRLKSKVNSYVLGAHEHTTVSTSCEIAVGMRRDERKRLVLTDRIFILVVFVVGT